MCVQLMSMFPRPHARDPRYDGALGITGDGNSANRSQLERKTSAIRSLFNPATRTGAADGSDALPTHGDSLALERAIRGRIVGKVFNICVSCYRKGPEEVEWSLCGIFPN